MLKQYFGVNNEGKYYQGLNEVMGFLLFHYNRQKSLMIMEGIEGQYLWDYTNLPFSDCLIPILKAIEYVVGWQKPEWRSPTLFMAVQSKKKLLSKKSDLLSLGPNLVY